MNTATPALTLVVSDTGAGRPILLLHGGAGPATVLGLAQALGQGARVLVPTHPGFDGTPRPAHLASVTALAQAYLHLLEQQDLHDVIVIGSSMGGWAAAHMAALDSSRIGALVLINAVGIQTPAAAVKDVSGLARPELVRLASHNPAFVMAHTPPPTPERMAVLAANMAALGAYDNGNGMMAPGLRERLASVMVPALVLWGESDGLAPPAYGRAYAQAFGSGSFELIAEAGHLPQIEQPAATLAAIGRFIAAVDARAGKT